MKRKTEAIVRLAAEKSHNARSRVLVALQEMQQQELAVTFVAVCPAAHVSQTLLIMTCAGQTWSLKFGDCSSCRHPVGKKLPWRPVQERATRPRRFSWRACRNRRSTWNARCKLCTRKTPSSTDDWRNGHQELDEHFCLSCSQV